jgi:hypothetical protein
MEMARAARDARYLMLIGIAAFLMMGAAVVSIKKDSARDLTTAYYRGVCLLTHCDPYSAADMEAIYANAGEPAFPSDQERLVSTRNIYLPGEFPFVAPLALVPIQAARAFWIGLIAASFVLASFLMWKWGARYSALLSAGLVSFCLINSPTLFYFGNPAAFLVPFTIFAVWCFLENRFVFAGIFLLAVCLIFKPHNAAFVWMYFLLSSSRHRRQALWTAALVVAICIPAFVWASHISPNWLQEISSNLHILSAPGSASDPSLPHGTCGLINLQAVTSLFFTQPRAYDLAAYLICAPLLLLWLFLSLKPATPASVWLALASIAPLSLLPVYHRQYDAKLLLLAVPACAMLWYRRGIPGWVALGVTAAAFTLSGDFFAVALFGTVNHFHPLSAGPYGRLLTAILDFPVCLGILAMAVFYLWAYAREVLSPGKIEPRTVPVGETEHSSSV